MKNYLSKFEFRSGLYENIFYQQINADSLKKAIIKVVASFMEIDEETAKRYIADYIGKEWTVDKFWKKMDNEFYSQGETEAYSLISINEIKTDLDSL